MGGLIGDREVIILALGNQINLYSYIIENDPELTGEDRELALAILNSTIAVEQKYREEFKEAEDVPLKRPNWNELKG